VKDPYLLHIFNPTKNASPFDVNMAYEAAFDGVIPYTNVTLEEVHVLTQDTIFSRGPKGAKRTGIFIGGREFGLAMDMLQRARAAMVPPFEVSVFADPSGAITTAAALVAAVERLLQRADGGDLRGKRVHVLGGTGPVGICAGILAESCGAEVCIVSHRGRQVAGEVAREYNARFESRMRGAGNGSEAEMAELLRGTEVLICAARAGVRVVSRAHLGSARALRIAADANAVPPSGIEGLDARDSGKVLEDSPGKALGIGALAVGDIKYKLHQQLFELMKSTEQAVFLDHVKAFEMARQVAAAAIS
jgi:methylene-tetrahydromethanopterin dehydrogenase